MVLGDGYGISVYHTASSRLFAAPLAPHSFAIRMTIEA